MVPYDYPMFINPHPSTALDSTTAPLHTPWLGGFLMGETLSNNTAGVDGVLSAVEP